MRVSGKRCWGSPGPVPAHLCAQARPPHARMPGRGPGAGGGTTAGCCTRGPADSSRRAHLAGARRVALLVHAGGGGLQRPRRCPCPAPQPRPGPRAHVKGLAVPRDSGREPEPLSAFTTQACPEAGGCLGPSAPPGVRIPG